MARKPGQNKTRKAQKPQKKKSNEGNRSMLSARLETALKTIFQDIMNETLSDAKEIAEQAGKGRISLKDVEAALQKLCSRFFPTSIKLPEKKLEKQ